MTRVLLAPIAAAILALSGLALAGYVALAPRSVAPSLIGGPFTLVAQDGRVVTDADFKGAPALVFFGYTHCPDICPTDLAEIADVFKALGPKADIHALFVTVDPERDTPAVLKDYVSAFDDPRIIGLTGDRAQIEAAIRSYRVYARRAPGVNGGDYTMDHPAIVYLIDKTGRFVNAFNLEQKPQAAADELRPYL